MSITFSCDQCTQRYSVEQNLAGKRIKCKKCGKVLSIPVPRTLSAPIPVASPIKKSDPEAEDRFGLSEIPDFLPEDDVPVARPLNRRGSSQRSAGLAGMLEDRTTKIAVFAGGGVIALVLVVALVVSMTSKKAPPATTTVAADSPALAQHRRVLKEGIAALSELTDAIAAITDEASAEAAEPKVRAAVEQFQAIADRSSGLARLGKAEKQKFEGEALDEYVQALVKWQAEMKRFRAIPGAPQKLASLAKLVNPPE